MIYENAGVCKRRVMLNMTALRDLNATIGIISSTKSLINLTSEQISGIIATLDQQASEVLNAHNLLKESFTATEPIEETPNEA